METLGAANAGGGEARSMKAVRAIRVTPDKSQFLRGSILKGDTTDLKPEMSLEFV